MTKVEELKNLEDSENLMFRDLYYLGQEPYFRQQMLALLERLTRAVERISKTTDELVENLELSSKDEEKE